MYLFHFEDEENGTQYVYLCMQKQAIRLQNFVSFTKTRIFLKLLKNFKLAELRI